MILQHVNTTEICLPTLAGRRGRGSLGPRKGGRRRADPVQQLFNWTIAVLLLLVAFYALRRVRSQGLRV